MKVENYILIILLALATVCHAADSTAVIQRIAVNEYADRERLFSAVYDNTSHRGYRYSHSLTNVGMDFLYNTQKEAVIPQEGSGYVGGDVAVSSFQLFNKGAVWGGASYTRGKIYNMQFNETSDYMRLAPYVMADSVGGDLSTQSYKISGGFNVRLPHKFDIAAEAAYRATIEARRVDPRPKNIVSDLNVKVATSYGISDSMRIGVHVGAGIYNQSNILKFYSEKGTPNVVHLTGLGNRYVRFDGSNTSTVYNGYSAEAGAALLSLKAGWNSSVNYRYSSYTNIISTLNNLPMSESREHAAYADLSYHFIMGKDFSTVGLQGGYVNRAGVENIFGDAADNIYPLIGSIRQYGMQQAFGCLAANYGFARGINRFTLTYKIGYKFFTESYFHPSYLQELNHLTNNIEATYMAVLPKWIIETAVHASYNAALHSYMNIGEPTLWNQPVRQTFNQFSHSHGDAGLSLSLTYAPKPHWALTLKAAYKAAFLHQNLTHTAAAAFGVKF